MTSRKSSSSGYNKLKLISVNLPESYLNGLDKLVKEKQFPSRSEAIRTAIRELLRKYKRKQAIIEYHLRKGMIIG